MQTFMNAAKLVMMQTLWSLRSLLCTIVKHFDCALVT